MVHEEALGHIYRKVARLDCQYMPMEASVGDATILIDGSAPGSAPLAGGTVHTIEFFMDNPYWFVRFPSPANVLSTWGAAWRFV